MKQINTIMVPFILLVLVISGCASENQGRAPQGNSDFPPLANANNEGFRGDNRSAPPGNRPQFNRSMNPREDQGDFPEDMQQRFEEMQQQLIDACQGKTEGEACQIQSPMGETEGNCRFRDEQLVCEIGMPDRPLA